MFYRARQFISALFAQISEMDKHYVKEKLSEDEQKIFYRMSVVDQRHCLDVAYTMENLLKKNEKPVNEGILVKAALLHDIGKMFGVFRLWHRVAIVLFQAVSGIYWDKLSYRGKSERSGSIFHTFYVYREHPCLGAKLLDELGVDKIVVELVRQHHLKKANIDIPELELLITADELN